MNLQSFRYHQSNLFSFFHSRSKLNLIQSRYYGENSKQSPPSEPNNAESKKPTITIPNRNHSFVNSYKTQYFSLDPTKKSIQPITIILDERDLLEKFIKGGGPGGQKVNKCNSCVQLKHIPTEITVKTQRFRDLVSNRKEARKLLVLELDDLINGQDSKRNIKFQKERMKKAKRELRSKRKYLSLEKDKRSNPEE